MKMKQDNILFNSDLFECLRDCVQHALKNGSKCGDERKEMLTAIILESKRVGFLASDTKSLIETWDRCSERPSRPGELIRLYGLVDWHYEREGQIGCEGKLKNYCIGKDICKFKQFERNYALRGARYPLPFSLDNAIRFLEIRYKNNGHTLGIILRTFRLIQIEKDLPEKMYISVYSIRLKLLDTYKMNLEEMQIWRLIDCLIVDGLLEKVERGKSGIGRRKANGYRFLHWEEPGGSHNNSMYNKEGDTLCITP